jgi:hypothetical protein
MCALHVALALAHVNHMKANHASLTEHVMDLQIVSVAACTVSPPTGVEGLHVAVAHRPPTIHVSRIPAEQKVYTQDWLLASEEDRRDRVETFPQMWGKVHDLLRDQVTKQKAISLYLYVYRGDDLAWEALEYHLVAHSLWFDLGVEVRVVDACAALSDAIESKKPEMTLRECMAVLLPLDPAHSKDVDTHTTSECAVLLARMLREAYPHLDRAEKRTRVVTRSLSLEEVTGLHKLRALVAAVEANDKPAADDWILPPASTPISSDLFPSSYGITSRLVEVLATAGIRTIAHLSALSASLSPMFEIDAWYAKALPAAAAALGWEDADALYTTLARVACKV